MSYSLRLSTFYETEIFFNIWKNWLHKITPDEASALMNNLDCSLIKISLTDFMKNLIATTWAYRLHIYDKIPLANIPRTRELIPQV